MLPIAEDEALQVRRSLIQQHYEMLHSLKWNKLYEYTPRCHQVRNLCRIQRKTSKHSTPQESRTSNWKQLAHVSPQLTITFTYSLENTKTKAHSLQSDAKWLHFPFYWPSYIVNKIPVIFLTKLSRIKRSWISHLLTRETLFIR